MHNSLFTDKGFALVSALIIMTLLAALGSAAYMMTNMGFAAVSAERRYQLANWAADYAIGAGASFVIDNAICPPSTTITPCASGSPLASGATCDYFSIPDVTGTFCTIYAKGKVGTAQVIKTAVVPRMGSDWGGIVTRGGTITLSGSSAVAGCDDDEASYANKCGMMPALIAPPVGTNLSISSTSTVSEMCKTEGKMKGLFGNPPHYQPEIPDDLVPKYFGVTDANNSGSAWDEFLGLLEGKYSVTLKDGSNNPTPPSASAPILPPVAPTNESDCNFTGTGSCATLNSTTIKCDGGLPSEKNINLNTCTQVYLNSTGVTLSHDIGNKTILSTSNVTVGTSSSNLSVRSNGSVTLSGSVTNANISANTVTVNANVSGSTVGASGNINFSTNINNLSMRNSKFVSGGTIFLGCASTTFGCTSTNQRFNGTLTNTNLFSDNLSMNFTSTSEVAGGTIYSRTSTGINSNGALNVGTVANPILLLAGNTSMSVPGNLTINGLIYTTATNVSITGAVELQGALINNSTSANISNTGNGIIQFNKQVLDALYTKVSDLMNKPKCGGGNKKDWIANTKMTLY
jgi:hypothetical protein